MDINRITYHIDVDPKTLDHNFSDKEAEKLRPICESLAMLDGNAFFGEPLGDSAWRSYLKEAYTIYEANGGDEGWAGNASFIRMHLNMQQDPELQELWGQLKFLAMLKGVAL